MTMYEDVEAVMGDAITVMGGFLTLKAGSAPIVGKFVSVAAVDCNAKEMEPSQYGGRKYAFCLENGKTFEYVIESLEDSTQQTLRFDKPMLYAAVKAAGVMPGDYVMMQRTGTTKEDTRYMVRKLTEEDAKARSAARREEILKAEQSMGTKPEPITPAPVKEGEVNVDDLPF